MNTELDEPAYPRQQSEDGATHGINMLAHFALHAPDVTPNWFVHKFESKPNSFSIYHLKLSDEEIKIFYENRNYIFFGLAFRLFMLLHFWFM